MLGLEDPGGIVYRAILTAPSADVSGLCDRTGLPEDAVRTALTALAGLGLVHAGSDAPGHWEPVSPLPELAALVPHPRHIQSLVDLEPVVHTRALNLARSTTAELRVTAPQAMKDWPASLLDEARLAPGVTLRVLHPSTIGDDPAATAHLARLTSWGAQARTAAILPPVLVISDQQAALVLLDPAHPGKGAVGVREPAIAATLAVLFDSAWDTAAPLTGTLAAAEPAAPSADGRVLLRLLADGLTDDAAARRLGISVRTVRRQVAALMTILGASSRFQAGHKAAQRGWL